MAYGACVRCGCAHEECECVFVEGASTPPKEWMGVDWGVNTDDCLASDEGQFPHATPLVDRE